MEDEECEHEWENEVGVYGNAEVYETTMCVICGEEWNG